MKISCIFFSECFTTGTNSIRFLALAFLRWNVQTPNKSISKKIWMQKLLNY